MQWDAAHRSYPMASRDGTSGALDGENDALADLRGAERSDKIPKAWMEHGCVRWFANCVKSPKTKDSVRNPHNKQDKELYRV